MQIRHLGPSDASAYRTLRLRALREFPQAFTSSYEEDEKMPPEATEARLASPHNKFWGAFDGNNYLELCGIVGLQREMRAKNRHKATVVGMYVAQEQTGCGVGAALMRALVEDARRAGIELLVLTVTEDGNNWGQIPISSAPQRPSEPKFESDPHYFARRLYERCGFRSFGIEPRAIKVDGRAYSKNHMYLELTSS